MHQQHGNPCHVNALSFTLRLVFDSWIRNAPDFASRAATPNAALWPQIFPVPLSFSIVSFLGIIVSSSSETIYGEAIWSPIDLLGRFLDDSPSSATRFGVWFIAFAFIIAQARSRILLWGHPFIHPFFCHSSEPTSQPTRLVRDAILLPFSPAL